VKILIINKFLYPNGGSETYIFSLGDVLRKHGHEVQYFGMEHEGRCVGNAAGVYTRDMEFHSGSRLSKITYPVRVIYSSEARRRIRLVLEDFRPDICHLNNFNYQLTPSIILEIRKWERECHHPVRIIYTAHDYQLICPNHMLYNPMTQSVCEKCLSGAFGSCLSGRCVHGSRARSLIGMAEAAYWNRREVYRKIDAVVCPSAFLKSRMDKRPVFRGRTVVLHNFIPDPEDGEKKTGPEGTGESSAVSVRQQETVGESCQKMGGRYVLYFGRFSEEKGIRTLLVACRALPEIPFVFAGSGPLESEVRAVPNGTCTGFLTGEKLRKTIREAEFSICPSEWYENCPYSVMESQILGTPVLGAKIGGIPELIREDVTGELFESGNKEDLIKKISDLWNNRNKIAALRKGCSEVRFDGPDEYYQKIMAVYQSEKQIDTSPGQ
jgi:glycosyltransferase involved in cell wall biosynthesis